MSSRRKDRRSAGKQIFSIREPERNCSESSREWSEWLKAEDGQVYKWRIDAYGQVEYKYPERKYEPDGSNFGSSQTTGDNNTSYGSGPCTCGSGCAPASGCCNSTRFGGGREEQRENRYPSTVALDKRHWREGYESHGTTDHMPSSASYTFPNESAGQQTGAWTTSSTLYECPAEQEGLCGSFAGLDIGEQTYTAPVQDSEPQEDSDSYTGSTLDFEIQDAPPLSDQGTLFGRICEEMGLFKETYGSGHRSDETIASFWNPSRLRNNCVFVSVGYILGMDAEALSALLRAKLHPHVKGMEAGEMELILGRLPGCHPIIFPFDKAIEYNPRTQQRVALRIISRQTRTYKEKSFAIGYQRVNGSGHCVVAKPSRSRNGSSEVDLKDYRFMCYQNKTKGVDMTRDVRDSFIRFAIFLDPRKRAMQMDYYYGTTVSGPVSHIQVEENDWYSKGSSTTDQAFASASKSYPESGHWNSRNYAANYPVHAPEPVPNYYTQSGYRSSSTSAGPAVVYASETAPNPYPKSGYQSFSTYADPAAVYAPGTAPNPYTKSVYYNPNSPSYTDSYAASGSFPQENDEAEYQNDGSDY